MARYLLHDATIKSTKEKRLNDGAGLYLLIKPNGNHWWRFDYSIDGKRKTLSLGVYPVTGLAAARDKADDARKLVANGIDPSDLRKDAKTQKAKKREDEKREELGMPAIDSFEEVAREWFTKHEPNWAANHGEKIIRRLERDVFPWLGGRPIKDITAKELLDVLRKTEARGALETAHRALQNCGQIFRYAIATDRAERNIALDLQGALPPTKEKHHASITDPKAIGELLRAIDSYQGSLVTRCALQLAPLVFVRPGELRQAEWSEFDFEAKEWRIPAHKMKMKQVHIVPLSNQALAILEEIKPLTGNGIYIFPSARTTQRPMSENAVLGALRRMNYTKDEMTGHGFRSMASTILNEQGWHHDAIERQLAHGERNSIRAAYNYAEYLSERRKMMQAWADYLDTLKVGNVIPVNFGKTA